MGIELPRELVQIAAEIGLIWPCIDEDALRKQAEAWRFAHRQLTSLAEEATQVARAAMGELSPEVGENLSKLWSGFADLDLGKLGTTIQGASRAAERLDNAADSVSEAKVNLVQALVEAARMRDVAGAAATIGPAVASHAVMGELKQAFEQAAQGAHRIIDELAEKLNPPSAATEAAGYSAGSALLTNPISSSYGGLLSSSSFPQLSSFPDLSAVRPFWVSPTPSEPADSAKPVVKPTSIGERMFPTGEPAVISPRPSRQITGFETKTASADVFVSRFPPYDHPQSYLLEMESSEVNPVNAKINCLSATNPLPVSIVEGYDPHGGMPAGTWARRYLGGTRGSVPEYAWPPGALHPEGGDVEGVAAILPEGVVVDRFGLSDGRIFAPEGTNFAQRSLPPGHLAAGYRRYRVLRALPVWRAASAAWFGQVGGGVRYRSVHPVAELIATGYLADVSEENEIVAL